MTTKVLVFESETQFAQSLSSGLGAYDCVVKVVEDGEEGIASATSDPPDLILLTIELPRMNGFSVCNKLRRNKALKKVPLLLMSSEATEETFEQHKRLRTRADEYIHKPITVEELVAKLDGIVLLEKCSNSQVDNILEEIDEELEELVLEEDEDFELVAENADGEQFQAGELNDETDQAFGNLLAPSQAPPAPPLSQRPPSSGIEELELEEDDGLKIAPEVASSEVPQALSVSPQQKIANEALTQEVDELKKRVAELERDLKGARDAATAEEDAKAQVLEKKEAERALAGKEIDLLKKQLENREGPGTAREFLDLREQLNRKDKEILDIRDQLTSKGKEVIRINEDNISLGRDKADLEDQVSGLETSKLEVEKERDTFSLDKAQATKRGDDFKAKSERLQEEIDARILELKNLKESHENIMATRDAQEASLREDHRSALIDAGVAADAAQEQAISAALAAAQTVAAGELEAALVQAAEDARISQADAITQREVELKAEQDAKMAALHRANEESLRKLRAEHDQATEEALQLKATELKTREDELVGEKEAELEILKRATDASIAELEARGAALSDDLRVALQERDAARATIVERDNQVTQLEGTVASEQAHVADLSAKLDAESGLLSAARAKWEEDSAGLRAAKEALEQASAVVVGALDRPMP